MLRTVQQLALHEQPTQLLATVTLRKTHILFRFNFWILWRIEKQTPNHLSTSNIIAFTCCYYYRWENENGHHCQFQVPWVL